MHASSFLMRDFICVIRAVAAIRHCPLLFNVSESEALFLIVLVIQ